jgi:hypothetical protein
MARCRGEHPITWQARGEIACSFVEAGSIA